MCAAPVLPPLMRAASTWPRLRSAEPCRNGARSGTFGRSHCSLSARRLSCAPAPARACCRADLLIDFFSPLRCAVRMRAEWRDAAALCCA
jgi:hypothetical protein